MNSPRSTARIAGVLYLLLVITGAFAHLVVRDRVYEPGNAAVTVENIVANSTLFRLAVVADILMATVFVFLGIVLYMLLKDVDRKSATAMVVFVSVGAGMILVNLIFHFAAWLVATDATYATALGVEGSEALVLLLVEMHHYGYLLAGVFFGLWLLPLGYLAYRSDYFPRVLGILLMAASASWIIDTALRFAFPDLNEIVHIVVTIPTFAEFLLLLYLLVKGVRSPARSGQTQATGETIELTAT